MIELVKGDLFAASPRALAHGCNCAGAMGKGIAVEFKRRWPKMYEEYHALCEAGRFQLGDVFAWSDGAVVIFNLATRKSFRGKVRGDLDAIARAAARMLSIAEERGIAEIGMPKIGAGLGGLDWEDVRAVLARAARSSAVKLKVFEL
jgi:O-acetyl-ADP-ribose deacetylase (regulator of RNase III)